MARALLRRRRIVAVAVEDTPGTAKSLVNADGALIAFNPELSTNITMVERQAQGSLSRHASIPGPRQATLTCMTHLHGVGGSGTSLWATTLLAAADFKANGSTYALDSTDDTTLTAGLYEDGRLHMIAGAKNNPTFTFRSGQPVEIEHSLTGKYLEPADSALITPTYPSIIPPRFVSATLTIGGTAWAKIGELVLSINNEIVLREDASSDDDANRSNDGTGYAYGVITNRNVQFTVDPEAVLTATKNWYADLMDVTEAALSIVVGTDANNTITFSAPKVQVVAAAPGDRNGILTDALTFQCNINGSTGDSELSIAFS